jgi:hypothetical protein
LNNEEQHNELREKLLKLPRAKAREGFENELLRRINLLDTGSAKSPVTKSSFWESLFERRSLVWSVPATSIVVIAIVFVGVYFAFYKSYDKQNTLENKSSANQQSSVESLKINPLSQETAKNDIPGKDIANDLEIGKTPKFERKSDMDKGLNETFVSPSPKPVVSPSKVNVIDSRKESTIYEKADEIGKTGKSVKSADEVESSVSKGFIKEEKKTEESTRINETERKISSPLLKDVEKGKKGNDGKAVDKVESKEKADTNNQADVKKKDDTKKKEESRKKEEAKKKESLEKLKEEIKEK